MHPMFNKLISSLSSSNEKLNAKDAPKSLLDAFTAAPDTRVVEMTDQEQLATTAGGSDRQRIDQIGLSATFRFSHSYGDKTHA
jgi:hypothetical protein